MASLEVVERFGQWLLICGKVPSGVKPLPVDNHEKKIKPDFRQLF